MTIDQLTKLAADMIRKGGFSTSATVAKIWATEKRALSKQDMEQLAFEGLYRRVGDALVRGTYWNGSSGETVNVRVAHAPAQASPASTLVRVYYRTGDGTEKPLIRFTISDFDFCINRNDEQISGLAARNRVFEFGKKLLRQNRAIEVSKLPPGAQNELALAWEDAVKSKATEPPGAVA